MHLKDSKMNHGNFNIKNEKVDIVDTTVGHRVRRISD